MPAPMLQGKVYQSANIRRDGDNDVLNTMMTYAVFEAWWDSAVSGLSASIPINVIPLDRNHEKTKFNEGGGLIRNAFDDAKITQPSSITWSAMDGLKEVDIEKILGGGITPGMKAYYKYVSRGMRGKSEMQRAGIYMLLRESCGVSNIYVLNVNYSALISKKLPEATDINGIESVAHDDDQAFGVKVYDSAFEILMSEEGATKEYVEVLSAIARMAQFSTRYYQGFGLLVDILDDKIEVINIAAEITALSKKVGLSPEEIKALYA